MLARIKMLIDEENYPYFEDAELQARIEEKDRPMLIGPGIMSYQSWNRGNEAW
ncbi:MAG: hypothetical protein ACOX52_14475 [Verrucomicrobiota bacterium]